MSVLSSEIFGSLTGHSLQLNVDLDVEVPHQFAEGQSQLSWLGAVDVAIAGPRF